MNTIKARYIVSGFFNANYKTAINFLSWRDAYTYGYLKGWKQLHVAKDYYTV